MKTIITIILAVFGLFIGTQTAKAQIPVTDIASMTELAAMGGTAMQQLTTVTQMLNMAKEQTKWLQVAGEAVQTISDVAYIITISERTLNNAKYLMEYVEKTKVKNPKQALAYSGMVIYTMNGVKRNVERIGKLIEDKFLNADQASRIQEVEKSKREIGLAAGNTDRLRSEIEHQVKREALQEAMFESQNIKVKK